MLLESNNQLTKLKGLEFSGLSGLHENKLMPVGLEKVTNRIEADLKPVRHPSWSVSDAVLFDVA